MNDRMSDPTPTCRLGVTVTPRWPGFDFEGLDHEVPRAWHPAGIGPTAFLEALSAIAPVVESFFIDDARRLLPRIAEEAVSYRILASAGAAQDLHAWRGLIRFVFGRGGMLRGRWRAVAAYHRRDFHPWRYLDNRRFLSELRDTIVDPAWEVRAR